MINSRGYAYLVSKCSIIEKNCDELIPIMNTYFDPDDLIEDLQFEITFCTRYDVKELEIDRVSISRYLK